MKLSDKDIRRALEDGRLAIEPLDPARIGPISVDLTLGPTFLYFQHSQLPLIDLGEGASAQHLRETTPMETADVGPDGRFILQPGEFALGATAERVALPADLAGWLDGRSSLARVGLMVHATAHTLEPGWDGHITLEFFNAGNVAIALRPGVRICAVSFEMLSSPVERPYGAKTGAKYQGQSGPVASRIGRD